MEKVSNYELQRQQWQRRFLDMDHAALRQKLPELEETADQLRLWHFGRQFAVSREDGAIRCLSDDGPVSLVRSPAAPRTWGAPSSRIRGPKFLSTR